jgi:hypothetical protein
MAATVSIAPYPRTFKAFHCAPCTCHSFNNHDGLVVLEAGQTWEGEFRIGIEPHGARAVLLR